MEKDFGKPAAFKKLNRLFFTKENSSNGYVSWDIGGKEPTCPKIEFEIVVGDDDMDLTEEDYCRVIQMKPKLDDVVYKAVLGYINDDDLCNCGEGFFPRRDRLMGNFYVSYEHYYFEDDEISGYIMTHFTEMFCDAAVSAPTEQDYLGLEVCFVIDRNGHIEMDGINSSSI